MICLSRGRCFGRIRLYDLGRFLAVYRSYSASVLVSRSVFTIVSRCYEARALIIRLAVLGLVSRSYLGHDMVSLIF